MGIYRKICIVLALAMGTLAASASPGAAYTESTLHTYCVGGGTCTDGISPQSPLLKSGNKLYGVAGGGANNGGVVFQYNLNNGNYKVLYNFCSTISGSVCTDGSTPRGRLVIDTSGNLYGTTELGGSSNNAGTAWELVKPTSGGVWTLQTLVAFCQFGAGCADGSEPISGLFYAGQAGGTAYDGTSTLYGTTAFGGGSTAPGGGTVFGLHLSGGTWTRGTIHAFCPSCTTCVNCPDGIFPSGQVVMDASDNIWGTTIVGGSNSSGVAWELSPTGTGSFTETIVYNFCWNGAAKCLDGKAPTGVLLDSSGNIYGTTSSGGSGQGSTGDGIVFELTAGSSCTEGFTQTYLCETVLRNFCPSSGCANGQTPNGDLIFDSSGNIYGTTELGGSSANVSGGGGTVWKLAGTTLTTIYSFCGTGFTSTCSDGVYPAYGVTMDSSGTLYGETGFLGDPTSQGGTLFKITNP
jgi:uncharacterized repeat protein (TIGR03803 family)